MFEIKQKGQLIHIRMSHGKANTMDYEFCRDLAVKFRELAAQDVSACVLSGQGKIFSAGADLVRAIKEPEDYMTRYFPALVELFKSVFEFPKPVVAAVNGHAIAGGCVLAACCDYRLMVANRGLIGIPELLVGVPFPAIAMEVIRSCVNPADFHRMVYRAETFTADRALRIGLVDEVVDEGKILDSAQAVAEQLATIPPDVFLLTKRQLRRPITASLDADASGYNQAVEKNWNSKTTRLRIEQYVERTLRKP